MRTFLVDTGELGLLPEVQKQLLAAIEPIAKAEAAAARAPREPAVVIDAHFADKAFKPLFDIGRLANICAPLVPAHLLVGDKPRPVQG